MYLVRIMNSFKNKTVDLSFYFHGCIEKRELVDNFYYNLVYQKICQKPPINNCLKITTNPVLPLKASDLFIK